MQDRINQLAGQMAMMQGGRMQGRSMPSTPNPYRANDVYQQFPRGGGMQAFGGMKPGLNGPYGSDVQQGLTPGASFGRGLAGVNMGFGNQQGGTSAADFFGGIAQQAAGARPPTFGAPQSQMAEPTFGTASGGMRPPMTGVAMAPQTRPMQVPMPQPIKPPGQADPMEFDPARRRVPAGFPRP